MYINIRWVNEMNTSFSQFSLDDCHLASFPIYRKGDNHLEPDNKVGVLKLPT